MNVVSEFRWKGSICGLGKSESRDPQQGAKHFSLNHKAKQLTCTFRRSCFDSPTQITPGLCLFRAEFCGVANS
jgi:hypothetical protein